MKTKRLFSAALYVLASQQALSFPALADSAQGERWPRWYLGLSGGLNFLDDTDLRGASTGNVDFNSGAIATASLGYRPNLGGFGDGFRFELEGGYHNNSLDSATVSGTPTAVSKHVKVWSVMGNAVYDIRNASRWTPYVGAGLGWADVELPTGSGLGNTDDDDKTLAGQFLAGVAYSPKTIPLTEWTLGYRYFMLDDPEFATGGAKLKLKDYASHNFEIGARFRF